MTILANGEYKAATLKIATSDSSAIACGVQSLEGKRLILHAAERLAPSTAVSVQCEDVMFLGDIMCCSAEAENDWRMEIKVHQMLTGLQNLMNLRARLLDEGVGQKAGMLPALVPVRKSAPTFPVSRSN